MPNLTEFEQSMQKEVFEITAPQFTMLYKIFAKFKALRQEEAVFKIANLIVLLKRIQISDLSLFILFLMDDESKKQKIDALLPDFVNRTEELLVNYII